MELTPCSSSFSSCSGTLGELMAILRHWMLSSGMTYSSTSFSGRPRAVPCLAVDGMASSSMAPRSVVSWGRRFRKKIQPVNRCVRSRQCCAQCAEVCAAFLPSRLVCLWIIIIWILLSTLCLGDYSVFQEVGKGNWGLYTALTRRNILSCYVI